MEMFVSGEHERNPSEVIKRLRRVKADRDRDSISLAR